MPSGQFEVLRQSLRPLYEGSLRDEFGRRVSPREFIVRVAAGRFTESPFGQPLLQSARSLISEVFKVPVHEQGVADRQPFHLGIMREILRQVGDPDWEFWEVLEAGVKLGVDCPMPRTPLVFEEKTKWNLEEVLHEGAAEKANYSSLAGHLNEVRDLFMTEAAAGWMVEMSDEEARLKYGKKLHVAALAVVEEGDKIRVVHDGTHAVLINNKIRPLDQIRSPGAGEVRCLLRDRAASGKKLWALAGDVAKAHRRIKVREEDWGYQACRLQEGSVWLNCVGTYGVASAAYFWTRAAAGAIVRMGHYFLGPGAGLEILLYVDDLLLVADSAHQVDDAGFLVFFLCCLGVPFKWSKFRGGVEVSWVGYWLGLRDFRFGISQKRADWVRGWLESRLASGTVDMQDFTAVLGRLGFALGPLEHSRPFLAPLYAWAAAVGPRGKMRIPWAVLFIFRLLAQQFTEANRTVIVKPLAVNLGLAFRADAKAEGQEVVIGGWECLGGRCTREARWFSVSLNRRNAPWAFSRGEPYRTIASLELYATLISVMAFADAWREGRRGALGMSGATDNQGNSFVLARLMTSKFPLLVVLAELASQLRLRDLDLGLFWVPRDQNEEADALTNSEFSSFTPGLRVEVRVEDLPWQVLPQMLEASEDLYARVQEIRAKPKEEGEPRRRRPQDKLRVKDPW